LFKIWEFEDKKGIQILHRAYLGELWVISLNCAQAIWTIFIRKNAPKDRKIRPNGPIGPI
jgi:hypothetical protein